MQKQLVHWDERKTQILIFVLIGLYLLLFLPYWKPVLLGFLFAAACEPFVTRVRNRLHAKRTRVAYATVGLGLAIFIGLVALVVLQGYSQIYDLFRNPDTMSGLNEKIASVRDQFLAWASQQQYLSRINIGAQLDRAVTGLTNTTRNLLLFGAQQFISRTPSILLNLVIFLMAYGAFLVIQPRIWTSIAEALRLGEKGKEHFIRFERICGLALGSVLITGFIQSLLVTIGATIAGYGSLFMIFGITFIFALVPILGAGMIPVVLGGFAFIQGNLMTGIIMVVTAVVVGIADNILRGWLFSRAAKSNPAISIITLLGGITLMGFTGLFVAPVLEQLVMTYAFSDEGEPRPRQVTADDEPKTPKKSEARRHESKEREMAPELT